MTYRPVTDEDRHIIEAFRRQGISQSAIAGKLGFNKSLVSDLTT